MFVCFVFLFCPEPVEQVLPRQRAEGDDQAGCLENVSIIVFLSFHFLF